jgi:hypothetical protein
MIRLFALAVVALAVNPALAGEVGSLTEISPAGKHLIEVLDSMHVEEHWLAGRKVEWRSGEPIGEMEKKYENHTHCSAFAAAAAEKLGVYLLHPPEHSVVLLANAQQDWLKAGGTNQGWHLVESPVMAQKLANQGQLVVVSCKNPDPKIPGHIAIVRPFVKTEAQIAAEGPQVIQAGKYNHPSTTTKDGFKNHPGAFENKQLLYFAHSLQPMLDAQ